MKWSPGRLRNEFYNYLQEVYDRESSRSTSRPALTNTTTAVGNDDDLVLPGPSTRSHSERTSTSSEPSSSHGASTPLHEASSPSSSVTAASSAPSGSHASSDSRSLPSDAPPGNPAASDSPFDIESESPRRSLVTPPTDTPGDAIGHSTDIQETAGTSTRPDGLEDAAVAAEASFTQVAVAGSTPTDSRAQALRYA